MFSFIHLQIAISITVISSIDLTAASVSTASKKRRTVFGNRTKTQVRTPQVTVRASVWHSVPSLVECDRAVSASLIFSTGLDQNGHYWPHFMV